MMPVSGPKRNRFLRAEVRHVSRRRRSAMVLALAVFVWSGSPAEPCERFPFSDVAASAGLVFEHLNGAAGGKHLPETMGSGVAFIDFDGDGWLDLYLVQSGQYPPAGGAEAENRMFRNLGDGRFERLDRIGVEERGYGQGTLAADFDGDGDVDLYVANVGRDALLDNRGDGSFRLAALPPGEGPLNWSSSAAAADGDGDGDLDLYVTRYVDYDPDADLFCGDVETGERVYCDPSLYLGQADRYFRNVGSGAFEEATREAGFGNATGRGLGVLFVDLDDDGLPDIYVTNDLNLNLLFRNRGDGTFEDLTLLSGAGANSEGKTEAGMGVGLGDFDGDGDPDLAVGNFDVETNTLYRNYGGLSFEDVSESSGFGLPSFNLLSFGVVVADLDGDGNLDIFVANGHIFEKPKRENVAYRQPNLLLAGDGRGNFEAQRCSWLEEQPEVSRGAAPGDLDNDGDLDLVVMNNNAATSLLRNGRDPGAWLGVRLVGRAQNSQAVGASVVVNDGERRHVRWTLAGQSYQSSADRRLLFSLGRSPAESLEVTWPDGKRQRLLSPPSGRYLQLIRGDGP